MTILIGYDGSDGARTALDWAMTEARVRDVPLKVCSAGHDDAEQAEKLAGEALAHVHQLAPDLKTSKIVAAGTPAEVLLDHSAGADLVVVGRGGHSAAFGLEPGSVGLHVATRARVPVVVVRGETEPPPEFQPGCVVVGFDGTGPARAALRFALKEAWLRGLSLTVICAWTAEALAMRVPFVDNVDLRAVARNRFLAEISDVQARYPDVEVHPRFPGGEAAEVLFGAATSARLLVVGAGLHHRPDAWSHGSVARKALQGAPCPVAVVHPA